MKITHKPVVYKVWFVQRDYVDRYLEDSNPYDVLKASNKYIWNILFNTIDQPIRALYRWDYMYT